MTITSFRVGDTIHTTLEDGTRSTFTVTNVIFFPMGKEISILIEYHHEPSGKNGSLSLQNLEEWFKKADWTKAEKG